MKTVSKKAISFLLMLCLAVSVFALFPDTVSAKDKVIHKTVTCNSQGLFDGKVYASVTVKGYPYSPRVTKGKKWISAIRKERVKHIKILCKENNSKKKRVGEVVVRSRDKKKTYKYIIKVVQCGSSGIK